MSDLEAMMDPNHACDGSCRPYVPMDSQNLEELEESEHIDALYDLLNLVRENAALMFVTMTGPSMPDFWVSARIAAVLLDISEEQIAEELGACQGPYAARDIVDLAIRLSGEDGYIGRAMTALYTLQLFTLD